MEYNEYLKCKKPYQEVGHTFLLERKHACLFYKPGKGKTYPAVDAMRDIDASKNGKAKVLILSTADAVNNMWLSEIEPQGILPLNTVIMSFTKAIQDATKATILKLNWDIIVIDECLPGYVEILTDKGYKRFDSLNKKELIAQYNDDGTVSFVKPIDYIEHDYDGKLHLLEFMDNKILPMTENHVQPFFVDGKIEEHYAKEHYNSTRSSLIFAGKGVGNINTLSTLDKLAIAMQADGSIRYTSKKERENGLTRWTVNLRRKRKIELLHDYLDELQISSKYWKNGTVETFLLPSSITKKLSDYFNITDFGYDRAKEFINEISKWDGSNVTDNCIDYKSIIKENSDFVCQVATLAGYRTRVSEIVDDRYLYSNIQYRVNICKESLKNCQNKKWTTKDFSGKVYCVKVPSNKIVIRTDGVTLVTGNCHKIKSHNAKISKLVHLLAKKTEYVWGLTGTPRGNNDVDIYCQFHNMCISEWGDISYTNFVNICCDVEKRFFHGNCITVPTGINHRYLAGWERNIAMYSQRIGYDEEDDMPELNEEVIKIPFTPSKEYIAAEDGVINIPDHETTMTKLAAIQKLHQLANGFLYISDEYKRDVYTVSHNYKHKWLKNNVSDKQIIVYRFMYDKLEIEKLLDEIGKTHTEIVEDFKSGNYNVLLLQCSRCESFNLQMCNRIIFYTLDYSFIKYDQMIHRVWRMGQKNDVKIQVLIAEHSVEESIWRAVKQKKELAELFMDIKGDIS